VSYLVRLTDLLKNAPLKPMLINKHPSLRGFAVLLVLITDALGVTTFDSAWVSFVLMVISSFLAIYMIYRHVTIAYLVPVSVIVGLNLSFFLDMLGAPRSLVTTLYVIVGLSILPAGMFAMLHRQD
jgi:hypothetical protein